MDDVLSTLKIKCSYLDQQERVLLTGTILKYLAIILHIEEILITITKEVCALVSRILKQCCVARVTITIKAAKYSMDNVSQVKQSLSILTMLEEKWSIIFHPIRLEKN